MSAIAVRIFRAGTNGMEVALEEDATVKDALLKSGLNKKDSELIQINGAIKSMGENLEDGDVIVLAKNIIGG